MCLNERKYWAFVLSSLATYTSLMLIVVAYRIYSILLCAPISAKPCLQPNVDGSCAQARTHTRTPVAVEPSTRASGGGSKRSSVIMGMIPVRKMTEAKDWAGELISGQTFIGRVIVSVRMCAHVYNAGCARVRAEHGLNGDIHIRHAHVSTRAPCMPYPTCVVDPLSTVSSGDTIRCNKSTCASTYSSSSTSSFGCGSVRARVRMCR